MPREFCQQSWQTESNFPVFKLLFYSPKTRAETLPEKCSLPLSSWKKLSAAKKTESMQRKGKNMRFFSRCEPRRADLARSDNNKSFMFSPCLPLHFVYFWPILLLSLRPRIEQIKCPRNGTMLENHGKETGQNCPHEIAKILWRTHERVARKCSEKNWEWTFFLA